MGKGGSWFSAIKRVFSPHSGEKLGSVSEEQERNCTKDKKKKKKKGFGTRHGENNSFLPMFREPSSIEKILGEAEREHNLVFRPPISSPDRSNSSSGPGLPPVRPASPRVPSRRSVPPKVPSPKTPSPRATSPRVVQRHEFVYRPEPTPDFQNSSAIKIQSAFRGFMARRSFKALKGLVRLQGVVRGHNVKRQTTNAMKHMQLLVRVQSQIQSRRIQMSENQKSGHAKRTRSSSETCNEDWDDSVLTKEEKEARLQRKIDAIIKRERSMAYAYSHQLWKNSPNSVQFSLTGFRSGGFPLWWNWLEQQLPLATPSQRPSQPLKDSRFTPSRPSPSRQNHFNFDTPTPKSSKFTILTPPRPVQTPKPSRRHSRGRRILGSPFKDDDSLTSCPPFSVPNYMNPTVSAKSKVRPDSNPNGTPSSTENRRLSFKWNKGSLFIINNNKDKGSGSSNGFVLEKHKTIQSIGNLSVDSAVSMPATVGRKPFNRFA
ncbi:PREDICTED: protein IQ-DOMAIN 14-like isoform X2 [Tarenaya hassleriana]|uniref:protein IQ-DOMAIN 14-like isoform X2 n=1 Tax=Tarenaya hassleriana TaxID=28532 RepID=UPI00053C8EF3|nr:PREDICTED: protein IQ-DOMAIN 14-like isoform X2 [Tarenaya hassleriana]